MREPLYILLDGFDIMGIGYMAEKDEWAIGAEGAEDDEGAEEDEGFVGAEEDEGFEGAEEDEGAAIYIYC